MSDDMQQVLDYLTTTTTEALRKRYGPPDNELTSKIAVAMLTISYRYFAATNAPKAVIFDFFLDTMGVQKGKATLEEKDGKLIIVPPKPPLVLLPGGR